MDFLYKRETEQAIGLIFAVRNELGGGWSEEIYRKLLAIELAHHRIDTLSNVNIPAKWDGIRVGTQYSHHLLVSNRFLLLIRATLDAPMAYDFIKTRTYLKALGLQVGFIINFGRNTLQIIGTATK